MVVKTKSRKCPICDQRPINGNGKYCTVCMAKIDKDKRLIAKRNAKPKVDRFLSYRGWVVALHANGHADLAHAKGYMDGVLRPDLTPDKLPASVPHLNLDEYQPNYTRDQIKALKAELLRLVGAAFNPRRQNN